MGNRKVIEILLITGSSFIVSLGLYALFIQLFGLSNSPYLIIEIFGLLVVSLGIAFLKTRIFERAILLGSELGELENKIRCSFCTHEQLVEANELMSGVISGDALTDDLVEQWRQKNNKIFVCVLDESNTVIAAFGVIPLSDEIATVFTRGDIIEREIRADDILDSNAMKSCSTLYISGVVVRGHGSMAGNLSTVKLLWVMAQYLKQLYGTQQKRTLYALALTDRGENLLQRLGFRTYTPATRRRDNHNMYFLELTQQNLDRIEEKVPDYHRQCSLSFD